MLRILARVAAAVLATAAAYAAAPIGPASAAGCPTADGVTVVVDFHQLGGGVRTACVADGGGETAAQLFPAAGFPLTYVQRQPSFVCQVSGKPADNPCANTPPADAYWGLYWSDGKSGRWTYATSGAGGQRVPDGGYVGFSWQGSNTSTAPGASPAPHPSASPTPTQAPTHPAPGHTGSSDAPSSATSSPTVSPSGLASSASLSPAGTPSATKSGDASHSRKAKPSASSTPTTDASPTPTDASSLAPASSDPADPGGGGIPGWVAPAVILLLFGAAGAVAAVRRRRGSA